MKNTEGFNSQYLGKEHISNIVTPLFFDLWNTVYDSMERRFSEAYPAHIFKNVGRLKELV